MATMVRVKPLAVANGATVSTGAATLGVCAADEIAVMVGTSVPAHKLGSQFRETLKLLAARPRSAPAVVGGNVYTFLGAPEATAHELAAAAASVLATTVPTETQVGVVVGATAAAMLDKSEAILAAIRKAMDAFVTAFGS